MWMWFYSLVVGIVLHLYKLLKLRRDRNKTCRVGCGGRGVEVDAAVGVLNVYGELCETSSALVQDVFDLVNCVHWLPAGWLWAGRLSDRTVGVCGVVSTLASMRHFL